MWDAVIEIEKLVNGTHGGTRGGLPVSFPYHSITSTCRSSYIREVRRGCAQPNGVMDRSLILRNTAANCPDEQSQCALPRRVCDWRIVGWEQDLRERCDTINYVHWGLLLFIQQFGVSENISIGI